MCMGNREPRDLDFGTERPDLPEPWFPYIIQTLCVCVCVLLLCVITRKFTGYQVCGSTV